MKRDQRRARVVQFRCTEKERNKLKILANLYADGNLSEYLLTQALRADVKMKRGAR